MSAKPRFGKMLLLWLLFAMPSPRLAWGAAEAPSALALLRGAEAVRKPHLPFKARLIHKHISPKPSVVVECLVECDGSRRRFEHFGDPKASDGRAIPGTVRVLNGDELYWYERSKTMDAVIDSRARTPAQTCFDPRLLGLVDIMSASATVNQCLLVDRPGRAELVVAGQERIGEARLWRVEAKIRGETAEQSFDKEFWIEEPSFRVHRMTRVMRTPEIEIRCDVRSEFDPQDPANPLPKRVRIHRTESGNPDFIEEIELLSAEWPAAIPAERFTLKGMDLPLNTEVADYRIHRRLGYWNGEGLSERPDFASGVLRQPMPGPKPVRWLAFVGGAGLLVGVGAFVVWRSRVRTRGG